MQLIILLVVYANFNQTLSSRKTSVFAVWSKSPESRWICARFPLTRIHGVHLENGGSLLYQQLASSKLPFPKLRRLLVMPTFGSTRRIPIIGRGWWICCDVSHALLYCMLPCDYFPLFPLFLACHRSVFLHCRSTAGWVSSVFTQFCRLSLRYLYSY